MSCWKNGLPAVRAHFCISRNQNSVGDQWKSYYGVLGIPMFSSFSLPPCTFTWAGVFDDDESTERQDGSGATAISSIGRVNWRLSRMQNLPSPSDGSISVGPILIRYRTKTCDTDRTKRRVWRKDLFLFRIDTNEEKTYVRVGPWTYRPGHTLVVGNLDGGSDKTVIASVRDESTK
jgi:hypothetical protein